ncbi:unnamed protein product [Caenorhabditis brenneri]
MSAESSRKRARGDESQEDPPRKIASGQLAEAELNQSDVVIIVEKRKFRCKKEKLSSTSKYFEKMFNSGFSENGQKEVELGGIATAEGFKLFLDVIEGSGTLTDGTIELALSLADYLESPVLEDRCVEFLSLESEYSKEEQFALGDKHNSMKLITQLCSGIKNSYELHEIVPVDINSLKSSTKTIVLQKSFELHGHRKPPAPPVPQQPEAQFEAMVGELIDQAAIVHHHGTILAEQAYLLDNHVRQKQLIATSIPKIKQIVKQDPRISILMNQLRSAENQIERNAIHAQIQVIKEKNDHIALEIMTEDDPGFRDYLENFTEIMCQVFEKDKFPYLISRGIRTENIAIHNHGTGEKTIDVLYRKITKDFEEKGLPQRRLDYQPTWMNDFLQQNQHWVQQTSQELSNVRIPDGLQQIPREINFGLMEEFIANMRKHFYSDRVQPHLNQEQNQLEQLDGGPEAGNQNDEDEPYEQVVEQDGQE